MSGSLLPVAGVLATEPVLKKVGRKQALTPELAAELRAKRQIYLQVMREYSVKALAKEYNLSQGSVLAYANLSHKRDARVGPDATKGQDPAALLSR